MIHTDSRPTIACAPLPPEVINDGRDPGDEHYDRPILGVVERIREWTIEGTDTGNGTEEEDDLGEYHPRDDFTLCGSDE